MPADMIGPTAIILTMDDGTTVTFHSGDVRGIRVWVSDEFLNDCVVEPEKIFGFPVVCKPLFEPEFGTPEYSDWEAEQNQAAMDAFWAARPAE